MKQLLFTIILCIIITGPSCSRYQIKKIETGTIISFNKPKFKITFPKDWKVTSDKKELISNSAKISLKRKHNGRVADEIYFTITKEELSDIEKASLQNNKGTIDLDSRLNSDPMYEKYKSFLDKHFTLNKSLMENLKKKFHGKIIDVTFAEPQKSSKNSYAFYGVLFLDEGTIVDLSLKFDYRRNKKYKEEIEEIFRSIEL